MNLEFVWLDSTSNKFESVCLYVWWCICLARLYVGASSLKWDQHSTLKFHLDTNRVVCVCVFPFDGFSWTSSARTEQDETPWHHREHSVTSLANDELNPLSGQN